MSEDVGALLTSIGLADRRVKNIVKDARVAGSVKAYLADAGVVQGTQIDEVTLDNLLEVAHKVLDPHPSLRQLLVRCAPSPPLPCPRFLLFLAFLPNFPSICSISSQNFLCVAPGGWPKTSFCDFSPS